MGAIAISILSLPLLYELMYESYQFIVVGLPDDHKGSTIVRGIMIIIVSLIVALIYHSFAKFLGAFSLAVALYVFFDPLLNMSRKYLGKRKDIGLFYYASGDNAPKTDKIMRRISIPLQIIIRAIIFTIGIVLYVTL